MDSKDQPAGTKGTPTGKGPPMGLNFAELETVTGKLFLDPLAVILVFDHEGEPMLTKEAVHKAPKSTVIVQLGPSFRLAITAQEAYDILDKAAKVIQAERGEE